MLIQHTLLVIMEIVDVKYCMLVNKEIRRLPTKSFEVNIDVLVQVFFHILQVLFVWYLVRHLSNSADVEMCKPGPPNQPLSNSTCTFRCASRDHQTSRYLRFPSLCFQEYRIESV